MTTYFQDGDNDVRPPLAAATATAPRMHVTPLACCMRYSSWSTVHSYVFIQSDLDDFFHYFKDKKTKNFSQITFGGDEYRPYF